LSQPSVSVQLRKLREIFSDPLLSPARGEMLPTTRAQALLPEVREALAGVRRLVSQSSAFDPKTAQLTWQIAAADYAEYAVLLPLLTKLRRSAPGVRIAVRQASHAKMFKQLDSGAIDLAFLAMDTLPTHLHHRILYNEHYVLVARKGHPALKRKLTLETFCELDHIVVSPDGGGFKGVTDAMLESRRRKRSVSLSTQHFLFVPEVVAQTDLVAVAPYRLVKDRADRLQILTPPLTIPSYDMAMIWHERSGADAAHVWLREQI
jgi:DNA-binding transcriptional LysR family regulator